MELTADGFIMKMVDKWLKKKEREFVKHHSTQEYKTLFAEARLSYIISKTITPPVKVHIAEKTLTGTSSSKQASDYTIA